MTPNYSRTFKRSLDLRLPSSRTYLDCYIDDGSNQLLLSLRGTLLDSRGVEDIPRARVVVLEVLKVVRNDDGTLPSIKDSSLAIIKQKLSNAKGTALKPDRSVLLVYARSRMANNLTCFFKD